MLGAAAATTVVTSCGDPGPVAGPPTSVPRNGELDRLPGLIKGNVVFPDNPRYDPVRLLYNPRYDGIRPRAVIEVADARDVATVITFARNNGLTVRVRNGGHSFGGYSTSTSIVIDVRRLIDVRVSADGETAQVGGGFSTLDAYRALWPQHKKVIPAGLCPTVGLSGATSGGGLGVLDRRHGVTSDNLLEVELVTADGEILTANDHQNADLYWATRGGGGGTFGVITALTYRLVPADTPYTSAVYQLPWSAAPKLVNLWQGWLDTTPRETWSMIQLVTQDPARHTEPSVTLEVVHAGPEGEVPSIVGDLLYAVGEQPLATSSETTDFLTSDTSFYCKGLQADECRLVDTSPNARIARPAMYLASDCARYQWPTEGIEVLTEALEKRQRDPVLSPRGFDPARNIGKVFIEPMDGAVHDVAADETAFVHRDAICDIQYQARWHGGSSDAVSEANIEWVTDVYEATRQWRSGEAYQNYIDPRLDDWERAYYGSNLERLRQIKRDVDPENFFSYPQSILPAGQ